MKCAHTLQLRQRKRCAVFHRLRTSLLIRIVLLKVTEIFGRIDADGDGRLTLQEVAAKEVAATKAIAEREFALADADSNGRATREEMFEEKNPLRAEELFVITSGQGKEKFAFADSNDDQALDLTEFFVFRYPRASSREEVRVTNLF